MLRTREAGTQGRVALITGGASGIGRALAEELARRDCTVVLADRQRELHGRRVRGRDVRVVDQRPGGVA